MTGRFVGYIDRIAADGVIQGWVIDLEFPLRPVRLRAWSGDRAIGETRAGLQRADVQAAGYPTASCGFSLRIAEWACDGVERPLSFDNGEGVPVDLSGPASFRCDAEAEEVGGADHGYLDYIIGGRVGGWSLRTRKGLPVSVDVLCDGEPVATAVCDRFRGDLLNTFGAQTGAFELELPARVFDGTPHAIAVRLDGRDLVNSPRTLSVDEQRLQLCAGALHINGTTRQAPGLGEVGAWLALLCTEGAELSEPSRTMAGGLAADALADAVFSDRAAARAMAGPLLAADPALAGREVASTALLELLRDEAGRAALRPAITRLDRDTPGVALLQGALQLFDGEPAAVNTLLAAAAGGETAARQAAALLLRAGRAAEAAACLQVVLDAPVSAADA